ncbi:hypothetical protein [Enterobacter hormaechei]|jgi:hypothetical protein|uniref:hypothetical protein n=1 Tax=Enterobacter cloacae complex TaxID=354276 RepID=UPI0020213A6F|nr:hypothetical protein [Enterobacter hormaechei]MCU2621406.1 hypothetical protein [Enterobacter hormaechei subsp. hoffmannii]MDS0956409.1 hypothetical protein [Enterobacter hormaechei]MDS0987539.1 hypothetical protein [Enterobacter hormaechei]
MKLFEMEGFLRGKCIPRDLKVNETNAEYLVRKFAALEARCAALAAENAVLKAAHPQPFGPVMMKALDAYEKHQDETPEIGMLDAFFILRDSIRADTTATDAFLAEVRAQGVEMCSAEIQKQTWDEREGDGMVAAIDAMEIYAALLRKGVQS